MKIQVAIDRVSLEEMQQLIPQLTSADIIELGTSLVKDFGVHSLLEAKKLVSEVPLLVDLKTMDEGAYEFQKYFDNGADVLTVMGASTPETIEICYTVCQKYGKELFIDLLACSDETIQRISGFKEAIYGLHFAKDQKKEVDLVAEVEKFKINFPQIKRLALAGSLTLEKVKVLKNTDLEILIVGSSIIKAPSPKKALAQFKEVLK